MVNQMIISHPVVFIVGIILIVLIVSAITIGGMHREFGQVLKKAKWRRRKAKA